MASRARSTSYNPPSSLESDYGSDFTPEEEEILNELVRNAAFPSDTASFAASFTGNSATITSTKRSALIGDIFDSSEIVDDTIDDQDKLEEGVLRLSQKSKSSASGHAIEDPTTGTAAGSMDPPPSTPPIQRAYFPDECGGWGGGWDGERPTTDEEGDGGYAARAKAVLRSGTCISFSEGMLPVFDES